jgi:hypothetical protein
MSEPKRVTPRLQPEFFENQRKVSPDELGPYAGKHIAWSWDGATILASGSDREEVVAALTRLGIPTGQVVFDYVDPPGAVYY